MEVIVIPVKSGRFTPVPELPPKNVVPLPDPPKSADPPSKPPSVLAPPTSKEYDNKQIQD
ncbi:hypothetical protein DPMN_014554 [Dreissena polymorpha]|uniref:Uncharacterized protein n=1 Tax=Dreissena polymorpha TaxID=45954 RepID=A0A9D4S4S6_DREPO|nr:hypothetical protein DPMN_014554 [Dreissena polymorpha]